MNALDRPNHQPTFASLVEVYRDVEKRGQIIKRTYSASLFDTKPFTDLTFAAWEAAQEHIPSLSK
jgi:hypothetical protein